jgi:arylsulfatase A
MKAAVFLMIAVGHVAVVAAEASAGRQQPNVLVIISDDQGYGDLSLHGNPWVRTPTLDRLAKEGVRLDNFFVSPLCAPTRAALLTGRHYWRSGAIGVCRGEEAMRLGETTLADLFKAAGYVTGCFGKWHNGENYPYHPNGRGFEEFFGFCGGHTERYFDEVLEHNGALVATKGYITDVFTDAALAWLDRQKGKPFFCYVAYNVPHSPHLAPPEYVKRLQERGVPKGNLAEFYGMIENMDDNIARLLAKLDALGVAQDTIVVFLTDNGGTVGVRHYNAGMSGGKGGALEGSLRVPCFIRWPRQLRAGKVVKKITCHLDLLPTLAAACGIKDLKTPPLDGKNILPLLVEEDPPWEDRLLFELGTVRSQRYRLQLKGPQPLLYDMENDLAQKQDVSAMHRELTAELAAAYAQWHQQLTATRPADLPPPIPVGHRQWPIAELNVHRAEGGDGRDRPWTNAIFRGWRKTDAVAEWKIDVVEAGEFDAVLLFASKEHSLGTRVQLTVDKHKLAKTIATVIPPDPLAGQLMMKPGHEWSLLPLGRVSLGKGRTTVALSFPHIAGNEGIDVRAVRFVRQP